MRCASTPIAVQNASAFENGATKGTTHTCLRKSAPMGSLCLALRGAANSTDTFGGLLDRFQLHACGPKLGPSPKRPQTLPNEPLLGQKAMHRSMWNGSRPPKRENMP